MIYSSVRKNEFVWENFNLSQAFTQTSGLNGRQVFSKLYKKSCTSPRTTLSFSKKSKTNCFCRRVMIAKNAQQKMTLDNHRGSFNLLFVDVKPLMWLLFSLYRKKDNKYCMRLQIKCDDTASRKVFFGHANNLTT